MLTCRNQSRTSTEGAGRNIVSSTRDNDCWWRGLEAPLTNFTSTQARSVARILIGYTDQNNSKKIYTMRLTSRYSLLPSKYYTGQNPKCQIVKLKEATREIDSIRAPCIGSMCNAARDHPRPISRCDYEGPRAACGIWRGRVLHHRSDFAIREEHRSGRQSYCMRLGHIASNAGRCQLRQRRS